MGGEGREISREILMIPEEFLLYRLEDSN